ncbi:hypothetical protein C8R44DRAFT_824751, partial [Mycena epipterygia]
MQMQISISIAASDARQSASPFCANPPQPGSESGKCKPSPVSFRAVRIMHLYSSVGEL